MNARRQFQKMCICNMLSVILMQKRFLERFTKTYFKKTNQKECRTEKVIKKKGEELYIKQNGYDNSFNSQIDKKTQYK